MAGKWHLSETGFNGREEFLTPDPRTRTIIQTHLQEYYASITHLESSA